MSVLPERRPYVYMPPAPVIVVSVITGGVVVFALVLPWAVRLSLALSPLYTAYAKWACQC